MKLHQSLAAFIVASIAFTSAQAITIPTVPVGMVIAWADVKAIDAPMNAARDWCNFISCPSD